MSIKKANKFFDELDRHQQEFVTNKQINANYSIAKWLKFLGRAVAYDTYGDKATSTLKKRNTIFIVMMIAGVIVCFFFLYAIPVPLIGLALFLRNRSVLKKFKHRDLNNSLRVFFFPVLQALKDMAGEDAKLAASLDFSDPRSKTAERSQVFNRNVDTFVSTYIMAKVKLKDQANLEFILGDQIKDMNWTKTSASGKTKYKSKSKVTHNCLIKLTVPKSRYPQELPDKDGDVGIDQKGDFYVLKTKIKEKRTGKDHILEHYQLLAGIQKIYAVLSNQTPSRDDEVLDEEGYASGVIFTEEYFDEYDYDSFDYEDSGYFGDDEDGSSIFDS